MGDSYLSDITFDDVDGLRVGPVSGTGGVPGFGVGPQMGGPTALVTTAAAGPGVALTAAGTTPATHTLTAGSNTDITDTISVGYGRTGAFFGLLVPTSLLTATITDFATAHRVDPFVDYNVYLIMTGVGILQNFFTSVTANGITLLSADAVFVGGAGSAYWNWTSPPPHNMFAIDGAIYPVTFV